MKENEMPFKDAEDRKEKIRARYQGIQLDDLEVIPAMPQENFFEDRREKRVAVYVRVSTDDPQQTSSYELQKNHYSDMVSRHQGWHLVDIYSDEGISGTSLQNRDGFLRMIADCENGKVDVIVTKSVSRFARNVLDCIGHIRKLASLTPPVGILFEAENLYTLDRNSEMTLTFLSTLAQEESHNKSETMNASIEMRFRRGIFLTPPLLGYDQDEGGCLVINKEEAKTVRLIFFMYLYGYTYSHIARTLTELQRKTKQGNTTWSPCSIMQILQNERHCGDVLARKTWTPSYLNHKSQKNCQHRNQYRRQNHHEAIVSRDDFIAVQHLISNTKSGNKSFLPALKVVIDGALKGFVSINSRWKSFDVNDYREASSAVHGETAQQHSTSTAIEVQMGDFDLRGFEIVRSQFYNVIGRLSLFFSNEVIRFSTECIRKLDTTPCVEMLVHPREQMFAVRPCLKEFRNAVRWMQIGSDKHVPRIICGTAYLNVLYEMLGWDTRLKYRVCGTYRQKHNETAVIFNMREAEVLPVSNEIKNHPLEWGHHFGDDYYRYAQSSPASDNDGLWKLAEEVHSCGNAVRLNMTRDDVIADGIRQIISDMEQERTGDGRGENYTQ